MWIATYPLPDCTFLFRLITHQSLPTILLTVFSLSTHYTSIAIYIPPHYAFFFLLITINRYQLTSLWLFSFLLNAPQSLSTLFLPAHFTFYSLLLNRYLLYSLLIYSLSNHYKSITINWPPLSSSLFLLIIRQSLSTLLIIALLAFYSFLVNDYLLSSSRLILLITTQSLSTVLIIVFLFRFITRQSLSALLHIDLFSIHSLLAIRYILSFSFLFFLY